MKYLFYVIIFTKLIYGQWTFSQFLTDVYSSPNDSVKNKVVDSFWVYAKSKGIPLIEGTSAHFLWRGTASSVYLSGDMNGWSSNQQKFTKLSVTNLYYLSSVYENDARLDYKFIVDGNWILDPNNPKTCSGGYGPNSELAMSGYVQPEEIKYNPSIPQGTLTNFNLFSKDLNQTYLIYVYLPPNYNADTTKRYPSVYVQDGTEYINLGFMVNVINNLLYQNKIEPLISIFIRPNNRNDEYAYGQRFNYEKFILNDVIRVIDSLYRTNPIPSKRGIMGASFGGNISSFISYRNPDKFGLCGNHSPAYWPNNNEVQNLLYTGEKKDIKFYFDWGTYESLWQPMRPLKDSLIKKGYNLTWYEWREGHSWGSWRAHTDLLLEFLFPANPTKVEQNNFVDDLNYKLHQNYPNPFNPSTTINYQLAINNLVTLKIYDILGREIETIVNETQLAGSYSVNWNAKNYSSGIYYCELSVGNYKDTKKMVLMK